VVWRLSLRPQHYCLLRSPLGRCSDIYTAWVGIIQVQTSRLTLLWCASENTLQICCNSAISFCILAAVHAHFSWRQEQTGERRDRINGKKTRSHCCQQNSYPIKLEDSTDFRLLRRVQRALNSMTTSSFSFVKRPPLKRKLRCRIPTQLYSAFLWNGP